MCFHCISPYQFHIKYHYFLYPTSPSELHKLTMALLELKARALGAIRDGQVQWLCTLLRTNPCSTYGRIIFPATFMKGINLLVTWRVHEFRGDFCCVFFLWLEHLGDTLCNVPLFKYLLEVATATTFTLACISFLSLIALLVITCLMHSFELHIEFQHFSETNRQVSML